MHALSLGTWWIHIASVLEWIAAIVAIQRFGRLRAEGGWRWLALAMVPALASAMAACTWHLFDNSAELQGLVVLQAGMTTAGNIALAIAAWNLLRRQRAALDSPSPQTFPPQTFPPQPSSSQPSSSPITPISPASAADQLAGDRQPAAGSGVASLPGAQA